MRNDPVDGGTWKALEELKAGRGQITEGLIYKSL